MHGNVSSLIIQMRFIKTFYWLVTVIKIKNLQEKNIHIQLFRMDNEQLSLSKWNTSLTHEYDMLYKIKINRGAINIDVTLKWKKIYFNFETWNLNNDFFSVLTKFYIGNQFSIYNLYLLKSFGKRIKIIFFYLKSVVVSCRVVHIDLWQHKIYVHMSL